MLCKCCETEAIDDHCSRGRLQTLAPHGTTQRRQVLKKAIANVVVVVCGAGVDLLSRPIKEAPFKSGR